MEAQYWIPTVAQNGQYLDIYSSMLVEGIIIVNTRIDQRISGLIVSCLLEINSNSSIVKHPKIYLNTKLGDVLSAMTVVDIVEVYKKKNIQIQTVGFGEIGAASALILAAGSKGQRKIAPHCQLILRFSLDNYDSTALQSEQAKKVQFEKINRILLEQFVKFSGKDIELLRAYSNREEYLDAAQIIELGLADEMI